jgi:PfaD family protein
MTVEADSGGHTDNRPLVTLLPGMMALRDELQARYGYAEPLRVGAAGGVSTPASVAAAFSMGAAYVMTGSVNQACLEAGTSPAVREMLAHAGQADVIMAPAADMFEMGVKVQVLKWGTMFAVRARKLYELYRAFDRLEDIPPKERVILERDFFRCSLDEAWGQTRSYFETRDPRQTERAEKDPHHKMALVFRSYLGRSSDWANSGEPTRKPDYQIWCGPAMGAFNDWTKGTFLERPENRSVVTVAMNLLYGAAKLLRARWLSAQGIEVPSAVGEFQPQRLEALPHGYGVSLV